MIPQRTAISGSGSAAVVRLRMAALIDVNACAPPRLRAIAARLAGRPAGIIGTAACECRS